MADKDTKKEQKSSAKQDNAQNTKEKVVTKYDLKVQRREAAKAQAKKDKLVGDIIGIAIVAALVCLVASFPIRSYLAVNETYCKVNGEKISRVEFDYNYNVALNNYVNQYGSYMSMFGMDLSGDLTQQMYSDDLTLYDYFSQLAVENISNNKAVLADAKAAGFAYDTASDYADFEERLREAASAAGITVKEFVRDNYGDYATLSRISDYVKESIYLSEYYDSVMDSKMPSNEEAESYYNDNKSDFDSVDYRLLTIEAELPEEPTEEDTAIAMAEALAEAETAVLTVSAEGDLKENLTRDSVNSLLAEWLFDSSRKAGDTTVIENTSGNSYYVVAFENRYLNTEPTVTIHAIITAEDNGQAILDEWKAGEATEESFADICDKYNDPSLVSAEGGLVENVRPAVMSAELGEWLSDESRTAGDTVALSPEGDTYSYILYYVGESDPWWLVSAKNTLLGTAMEAYMEEITANVSVEDPKENLKYLHIPEDTADTDGSGTESGSEAGDGSGTESGSEAGDGSGTEAGSEAGNGSEAGSAAQ